MKIIKTKFKGLLVIKSKKFHDNRGVFREIFKQNLIKDKIIFNVVSKSKKNVLRGLHMQEKNPQGKFVSVIQGKILDVMVDCRKTSNTFGKHFKLILSEDNCKSVYIPPGFLHGFLALSNQNPVIYGCTKYRDVNSEVGVLWNDKDLKIKWNIKNPILSDKDNKNIKFKDLNV